MAVQSCLKCTAAAKYILPIYTYPGKKLNQGNYIKRCDAGGTFFYFYDSKTCIEKIKYK